MSIKAKVTKLKSRLGVSHCPYCGVTASRRDQNIEADQLSERERAEFVTRFLFRVLNQEQLLQLLADSDPDKRMQIAHIYPLPAEEVVVPADGDHTDAEPLF